MSRTRKDVKDVGDAKGTGRWLEAGSGNVAAPGLRGGCATLKDRERRGPQPASSR